MKKSVYLEIFDKNGNKLYDKTLNTRVVKELAQIKKLDELEYNREAMVRLYNAIAERISEFARVVDKDFDHFYICSDFSKTAHLFGIGDTCHEDYII